MELSGLIVRLLLAHSLLPLLSLSGFEYFSARNELSDFGGVFQKHWKCVGKCRVPKTWTKSIHFDFDIFFSLFTHSPFEMQSVAD